MSVILDIAIPHHRDPAGLDRSLASIAAQSWIQAEIGAGLQPGIHQAGKARLRVLVLDDGSPPAEAKAAQAVAEAFAARTGQALLFAANPGNLGRPATRNRLLERVEAPYLAWLDCGDIWYPEKLARQFARLEQLAAEGADPDRIWVSCAYDWEEAGRPLRHLAQDVSGDQALALLQGERLRAYLWTLLGPARAFALAGRFDERLLRLQDLDLFLRFVRAGGRIETVEGPPLCRYFKANAGRSADEVRASHRIILAKNRAVLMPHPGAEARIAGRGAYLAARFAAANGRWGAMAGHLGRALLHDPALLWRRAAGQGRAATAGDRAGAASPIRPGAASAQTTSAEITSAQTTSTETARLAAAGPAAPLTGLTQAPGGPEQTPAPPPGSVPAAFRPDRRRIAFVIDRLAGRGGGAERVLIETANAMAARGHAVEVVSHDLVAGPPFYPLAPGVVLSNLRPPRRDWRVGLGRLRAAAERRFTGIAGPLDRLLWHSRHGSFHRRLSAHLAATCPDVAVAFLPPALTALAAAPGGIRRLASLHNVPAEDFDTPARWDPNPRDRRLRRAALARMAAITVLLPEFRDWFAEDLRPRVVVMPNAVPPVDPAQVAGTLRRPVVLAVGRLAAVKRHDLLLDAWAGVAGRFPGWELHIHGEGPERAALAARIARRGIGGSARLMGQSDRIGAQYLSCAILAHPAAFEGFGLAPAEALAAGLPVVAFADCPGVNRLVVDGVNGVLVPGGPVREAGGAAPLQSPGARAADDEWRTAALAAALAGLMADDARRARLGAAGPGSMAPYAPAAVADRWEALLMAQGADPPDPG